MNVKLNLDGKEKCVLFLHRLDLQEFLVIYWVKKTAVCFMGIPLTRLQQTQPFKEYEPTSSVLYMPIPQPPAGKS